MRSNAKCFICVCVVCNSASSSSSSSSSPPSLYLSRSFASDETLAAWRSLSVGSPSSLTEMSSPSAKRIIAARFQVLPHSNGMYLYMDSQCTRWPQSPVPPPHHTAVAELITPGDGCARFNERGTAISTDPDRCQCSARCPRPLNDLLLGKDRNPPDVIQPNT